MKVSSQLHAPVTLFLGKRPLYPKVRKKFHHYSCREFKHRCPARRLVTILTDLPRLLTVANTVEKYRQEKMCLIEVCAKEITQIN